ncbi:DUF3718 domain-containing protein [Thalassotalea mangrovi]|uniref:DUF3718 domain-containing protein n=1 Tax=Thalassotalea mangrovi TaxID=2572245 RepID=A0A4V5NW77_9GAMM|nr:DUF3718 domain-containing protein [Thalassotalea mangrovi]TKB45709.1 DUF3718 domain-containing protein [Thalassotalea mangrovi]
MNRTNLFAACLIAAVPVGALASDFQFVAKDSSIATKTCIAAASNDLPGLKRNGRQGFDGNYRLMSLTLTCNGVDVNSFAQSFGATSTNDFLNRRVSSQYRVDEEVNIIDVSAHYPMVNGQLQVMVSGK